MFHLSAPHNTVVSKWALVTLFAGVEQATRPRAAPLHSSSVASDKLTFLVKRMLRVTPARIPGALALEATSADGFVTQRI